MQKHTSTYAGLLSLGLGILGLGMVSVCLPGCASDSGSGTVHYDGRSYLRFSMTVNSNGKIDTDGRGMYAILLNSQGESIEVTDSDTFTDFIRFDGINFDWYTRQANLPNAGFTFYQVGSMNPEGSISSDGRTLNITVDTSDTNTYFNQYIVSSKFTAQAVTTDCTDDSYLGRIIDHMGDDINSNSLNTVTVSKDIGVTAPIPSIYPNDYLTDWITHNDLDADFPYVNFDIDTFEISVVQ